MKQRIIGLILVVAMAFLTLTGCGFNYAKKDLTKYSDFNAAAFEAAIQNLSVKGGDFGTNEAERLVKVENAIASALLKLASADDKLYAGKPVKNDNFFFCYYATDADGHYYFMNKSMDAAKPSSLQLGLSTLKDLNKAISDAVLADATFDIANHIYAINTTSTVVGEKDVVSLTYTEGKTPHTQKYTDLSDADNADLQKALVGVKVGVVVPTLEVGEGDAKKTYTNVKVEKLVKDNSELKTVDGDIVFISYTKSYTVPEGFTKPADAQGTVKDNKYTETVVYDKTVKVVTDPEGTTTFEGKLLGQKPGSVANIKVTETVAGITDPVEVTYSDITIHWILDELKAPIEVKYTPYDEELKADNSNAKKEKDMYNNEYVLNQKELTYHVFPVYYLDVPELSLDVPELSTELIVREFYTALSSTQVNEETNETEYVFSTLNDEGFVNGDKTLAALVLELVDLYKTHTTNDTAYNTTALKALQTAHSNRADGKDTSGTALANAEKDYDKAAENFAKSKKDVDDKIKEILACKKGETALGNLLVEDYNDYQYDTLEATYKDDLNNKLAKEIYAAAKANITYTKLPNRAVKQAYKAIMNTYKNSFYEGNYSTGSSTTGTSTSTESNYSHYEGNFDKFLIATLTTEKKINENSIEAAEKALWAEAEQTVKDIMLIYVLVDYFGEDEVGLTKEEKKDLKKQLEQLSKLYQQYGLSYSYNLDDYVHAAQFDKIFNHLLEEGTPVDDPNNPDDQNVVVYENIKYTIKEDTANK